MELLKFKDKYIEDYIKKTGSCFLIKKGKEANLKSPYRRFVFAIGLNDKHINKLKDLSLGEKMTIDVSGKRASVIIEPEIVLTSVGDRFKNMNSFLNFYEPANIEIEKFIEKIQSEVSNTARKNQKIRKRSMQKTKQ